MYTLDVYVTLHWKYTFDVYILFNMYGGSTHYRIFYVYAGHMYATFKVKLNFHGGHTVNKFAILQQMYDVVAFIATISKEMFSVYDKHKYLVHTINV